MADQQFCLRWNNHQSTLVSVFDSLLERGCLVDCTLAAEGRSLQAHKVVLSACSPYLEDLLSQHYDKHPILLLKDVKFEELQAMMDYMYRGEVNVAQDKLGHFLRAAESLQIKGLSDNGGKEPPDTGGTSVPSATKRTVRGTPLVRSTTNLEQKKQVNQEIILDGSSRDGSISPNLRKRRRRGGSLADDLEVNDTTGNAPESHAPPPAAAPATIPSAPSKESLPLVPTSEASDPNLGLLSTLMESTQTDNQDSNSSSRDNVINEKEEPTSEILLEPKTEYIDDDQDLTIEGEIDNSMFRPGPSHGRQSGYMQGANDSTDEVFMAAQDGGSRDAQGGMQSWLSFKEQLAGMQWPWSYPQVQLPPGVDIIPRSGSGPWPPGRPRGPGSIGLSNQRPPRKDLYACPQCGKVYTWKCSLSLHLRQECGKEPQFQCPHCPHRTKQKGNLEKHIFSKHSDMSYLQHTAPRGPDQVEQPQPQPQQQAGPQQQQS